MSIEKLYDQVISEKYDEDPFGLRLKTRKIALDQIKKHRPGKKVLDLAMGTAEALVELKQILPQVKCYGIDISQKMIDQAKKKNGDHRLP